MTEIELLSNVRDCLMFANGALCVICFSLGVIAGRLRQK